MIGCLCMCSYVNYLNLLHYRMDGCSDHSSRSVSFVSTLEYLTDPDALDLQRYCLI